jgi:hypothetical protein
LSGTTITVTEADRRHRGRLAVVQDGIIVICGPAGARQFVMVAQRRDDIAGEAARSASTKSRWLWRAMSAAEMVFTIDDPALPFHLKPGLANGGRPDAGWPALQIAPQLGTGLARAARRHRP